LPWELVTVWSRLIRRSLIAQRASEGSPARDRLEKPRRSGALPLVLACPLRRRVYVTGTVIVSETTLSSRRVIVAVVNATSVTVAVHRGFGHDPAGATGVVVLTVKLA
jgi:hypothetical protein